MARKTIVALYDRRSEAEAVRRELLDAGFDDLNVEVVSDGGFGGANDGHGGLFSMLTGWGVPHEDAHLYAEGVRLGGALAVVSLARTSAIQRALSIMDADGIHARPDQAHGGHEGLGRAAAAMRDVNTAPASGQAARAGVYPNPDVEAAPSASGDRSLRP